MKKIALATMLSAAMMITGVTPAFAESTPEDQVTFNDAVEIALKDAGLQKDSVTFNKKMHTYEDGMPVYEIQFLVPGETKYEYVIDDKTGEIREKDAESWEAEDDADYAALLAESQNLFDFEAAETQIVVMPASSTLIDECAKERQTELAYYKDGIEYDDGRIVYVLCAMLPSRFNFSTAVAIVQFRIEKFNLGRVYGQVQAMTSLFSCQK